MSRLLAYLLLSTWILLPIAGNAAPIAASNEDARIELQRVRLVCEWFWSDSRLRPRCYWSARSRLSPQHPIFRRPRELPWRWG